MNAAENSAFWTPDRVATLCRLWNEGQSAAEVAKAIGAASRVAIAGKVFRLRKQGFVLRQKEIVPKAPRSIFTRSRVENRQTAQRKAAVEPPPPRIIVPENVFDALPNSTPRPWTERGSGCNWPIGDGLSCCEPVRGFGWCEVHVAVGRKPVPSARDTYRALRRHIA